jgi:cysteine desulfurase family protein (TIGR01976 family)
MGRAPPERRPMPTIDEIRDRFPSLAAARDVFLDNAGGSQVPATVATAIRDYMLSSYVQLGADYATSRRATQTVADAHELVELLFNAGGAGGAGGAGRAILGSSTTSLCLMLADCYARAGAGDRDEIVIAETAHEANAGPWARLADRGFIVRTWPMDPDTTELRLDDLRPLLSDRTRIVAFPHVSNILGRVEDAAAITALAHEHGARVVVDGVAYAPHRAMDVRAIGADWYVYSTYKVFGPHMAALFGAHDAIAELDGPNHAFIPRDDVPYKFEPGGPSHEGCAGLLGLWPYLATLAGADPVDDPSRTVIERAFDAIRDRETHLQTIAMDRIATLPGVRLVGPHDRDASRVSTISFVHESIPSREIAVAANRQGFGIRYGHFYAHRLCARLAQHGTLHDVEDGVVRVSLLHYNTEAELEGLADCLETILR